MIGVVAKPGQEAIVEEFFELFKTPWEFYRQGRRYDVVVATGGNLPKADARLILVYGADVKNTDVRTALSGRARRTGGAVSYRDTLLPIYGELLTFENRRDAVPCLTAGTETAALQMDAPGSRVIRIGYDIFHEVQFLLSSGQPAAQAHIPTLELHILMLREWIAGAGISFVEIPPHPAGHPFAACLTHDIDFIGIRPHRFDHTMWGFLFRSTIGAVAGLFRRTLPLSRALRMWRAAVSLPFVYIGWVKDFWQPFDWYLRVEAGLPATYYLIPFKRRQGDKVASRQRARRAAKYDVSDLPEWTARLANAGCELGVHGIDAWHDADKGREELARIAAHTGRSSVGIRMHWLLWEAESASTLERAGYAYDSTAGYNETIGYRGGTTQVFRPSGARTLLELPMHIQDGALFYPHRLGLTEPDAEKRCRRLIDHARTHGGVLTVLWHDRSHAPERFWGDFYVRLVDELRRSGAWFDTAGRVVDWFARRRAVSFAAAGETDGAGPSLSYQGEEIRPPLIVRVHRPAQIGGGIDNASASAGFVDIPWNGKTAIQLAPPARVAKPATMPPLTVG